MPAPSVDRILIADYDPAWPRLFEDERQLVQAAIGEWAVAIEHVGSNAMAKSDFVQNILAEARKSGSIA